MSEGPPSIEVDVCICAFARREGLRRCLQSLAAQIDAPRFRVRVADNHLQPAVANWISEDCRELSFELQVLHAPHSNIAVARNALLRACTADWIAFLDDDEVAQPDWLSALYVARDTGDVVFGPVRALYADTAPGWLVRGDLLSKRPALRPHGVDTGPSANVLVRRTSIGALHFDESLGRTGGEDTVFFAALHDRGARLAFCEDAVACEQAAPERSTLRALLLRNFSSGHAHARVLRMRGTGRLRIAVMAASKCAASLAYALVQVASAVGWRRQCLRAALHAGVVAQALGAAAPVLYGHSGVTNDSA
jgi:succinoglycan biosynthesis protein ExoM